jgi:hypothetical protein
LLKSSRNFKSTLKELPGPPSKKSGLKAFDYKPIDQSAEIVDTAKRTGAIVKTCACQLRMKRFDILRSPHVNKTSRDQLNPAPASDGHR